MRTIRKKQKKKKYVYESFNYIRLGNELRKVWVIEGNLICRISIAKIPGKHIRMWPKCMRLRQKWPGFQMSAREWDDLRLYKSQILWEVVEIEREMILEISPGCSLVGLMLKLKLPILWPPDAKSWLTGKDSDAGRDWGQEEKGTTEDEMAGWHHRLDGHEFGWTPGVGDGQGGLECCNSWGRKVRHDWATELKAIQESDFMGRSRNKRPGS